MSPRIIQLPLSGRDRRHYVGELRAAEQAHNQAPATISQCGYSISENTSFLLQARSMRIRSAQVHDAGCAQLLTLAKL
jgi:hypothetical protein